MALITSCELTAQGARVHLIPYRQDISAFQAYCQMVGVMLLCRTI